MELERNFTFSSLILANCPLFSLNSYTNSELVHIGAPSTSEMVMWIKSIFAYAAVMVLCVKSSVRDIGPICLNFV